MANNTHYVRLTTIIINGVAHGFAINCQALINSSIYCVPFL
jgi:hypothetical protein